MENTNILSLVINSLKISNVQNEIIQNIISKLSILNTTPQELMGASDGASTEIPQDLSNVEIEEDDIDDIVYYNKEIIEIKTYNDFFPLDGITFTNIKGKNKQSMIYSAQHENYELIGKIPAIEKDQNKQTKQERRMKREITCLTRLKDVDYVPKIWRVYNIKIEGRNLPFLIMLKIEGIALSSYLRGISDIKSLPNKELTIEAIEIIKQICEILKNCHERKVVHRDIKSEHVLVKLKDNKPRVSLIDFGLVYDIDTTEDLTSLGEKVCNRMINYAVFIQNDSLRNYQRNEAIDVLFVVGLLYASIRLDFRTFNLGVSSDCHVHSEFKYLSFIINSGLSSTIKKHYKTIGELLECLNEQRYISPKQYIQSEFFINTKSRLESKLKSNMYFGASTIVRSDKKNSYNVYSKDYNIKYSITIIKEEEGSVNYIHSFKSKGSGGKDGSLLMEFNKQICKEQFFGDLEESFNLMMNCVINKTENGNCKFLKTFDSLTNFNLNNKNK